MSASINNDDLRNVLYSWPEMAMVLLYNNFYNKLIRLADKYTRNRQTSEDVLQEVFADVSNRHREIGLNSREPIEGYLMRAVRNQSITHYRKRTRAADAEKAYYYANTDAGKEDPAEVSILSEERRQFVHMILGTFPPRERECLSLQMFRGLCNKEIAAELGITEKAVEANLTRARKRLRRYGSSIFYLEKK
jgi:RNA polymerase sigma-70 factor, ECF subfamily